MMLLDTPTVGSIVRRLRDERGYTQGQVVEYTNARLARAGDPLRLTREWLSFVETGRIERPERERLEALAGTLGVPAVNLFAAAGYRADPVAVPEAGALDLLRQALTKLERAERVNLRDRELSLAFEEVGGDFTAEEIDSIRPIVERALERKRRQALGLPPEEE